MSKQSTSPYNLKALCGLLLKQYPAYGQNSEFKGITKAGLQFNIYALRLDGAQAPLEATIWFTIRCQDALYQILYNCESKKFAQFVGDTNAVFTDLEFDEFIHMIHSNFLAE